MKPMHDFLIVKRDAPLDKIGLIFLPENQIQQSVWCEVKEVGPGRILPNGKRTPMPVKVGDKVYCRTYTGLKLNPHEGWDSDTLVDMAAVEAKLINE